MFDTEENHTNSNTSIDTTIYSQSVTMHSCTASKRIHSQLNHIHNINTQALAAERN